MQKQNTAVLGTHEECQQDGLIPAEVRGLTGTRVAPKAQDGGLHLEFAYQLGLANPNLISSNLYHEEASLEATRALFQSLKPRDALEQMASVQMITVHRFAMDCFHRAAVSADQPIAIRDLHLKHAERLCNLYERLSASFEKRRGGRQQTIRIEHVRDDPQSQKQTIISSKLVRTKRKAQNEPIRPDFQSERSSDGASSEAKLKRQAGA